MSRCITVKPLTSATAFPMPTTISASQATNGFGTSAATSTGSPHIVIPTTNGAASRRDALVASARSAPSSPPTPSAANSGPAPARPTPSTPTAATIT